MARSTDLNSWEGVHRLAEKAGATYPELVAAQWALESGWGKHAPGNNFFGLKGPGQLLDTKEVNGGKEVEIKDAFLKFSGLEECVNYLVTRWYKDWKEFKGVNRSSSREAAARQLQKEGYATNPRYADKLIELMRDHAGETKATQVEKPVLFRLKARQDTVLKKEPKQATELGGQGVMPAVAGRVYEVEQLKELAADAHAWVKLGHNAGSWFVWLPHWERVLTARVVPEGGEAVRVSWSDFGSRVTRDLTVGEVLQWDKRRVPASGSSAERRILETAEQYQKLLDSWGQPLIVTSFYRPEPINQQVGGVRGSRHVTGEAFDCYPARGDISRFYEWARVRWTGGFGDGRSRGFLHFDTRNGGRFVPGAGVRPRVEWDY